MPTAYPSSIKNFTTKVNYVDTVLAGDVNDLQDELVAVETALGSSIRTGSGWVGSFDQITTNWTTLKDRIVNIEYGLNDAWTAKLPGGGTTGQVLSKVDGTNYNVAWTTPTTEIPSQSGNAGKYLTTDGSNTSWGTVTQAEQTSPFLLAGC